MSYQGHLPPGPTAGRVDPRAYQPATIAPLLQPEVQRSAPTLGQYFRSDTHGAPGAKRRRWAGALSFWLGLASVISLFVLGAGFEIHAFYDVALALGAVGGFFGLVAFVAGIGRVLGFFGIVLALLGNVYVIGWLDTVFNG